MEKVIFAEFSTMDFAELAARNLRQKFDGISGIKIKYRHQQNDGYNDMEFFLPSNQAVSQWGDMVHQSQLYTATYHLGKENEPEKRLESSIHVYAKLENAERIAGYLRAVGGLSVKISDHRAE